MTQEIKERYMAQVDQELIRQLRLRDRLLAEGWRLVNQFAEENPEAEYEDLEAAFGTPREFVTEMLSTVPPEELETARKKQIFQRRIALALVALVLVGTALFFFWRWQKAQDIVNGDFKVVISPVEGITDEEFEELMKQAPTDAQFHIGG